MVNVLLNFPELITIFDKMLENVKDELSVVFSNYINFFWLNFLLSWSLSAILLLFFSYLVFEREKTTLHLLNTYGKFKILDLE